MSRPVLLIAGGSRGIGASTARLAGSRGYDVAVNYKSNAKAAESVASAVEASGGNAIALQGDMGRRGRHRTRLCRDRTGTRTDHPLCAQRGYQRQIFAAR